MNIDLNHIEETNYQMLDFLEPRDLFAIKPRGYDTVYYIFLEKFKGLALVKIFQGQETKTLPLDKKVIVVGRVAKNVTE